MYENLFYLAPLFFAIAVCYSAAGLGGGSSYIAILSLFSIEFVSLRMIALLCNITVVSGSSWLFYQNGYLHLKKALPIVLFSVPFAFFGGRFNMNESLFFGLLSFTLLLASLIMFTNPESKSKKLPKFSNSMIGGAIGFLSGLVGIGGGIFLSPVLHISSWSKTKVIAATTAFFILVNSIAGLIGQISVHDFEVPWTSCLILIVSVFIGGQIGSRLTIKWLEPMVVKRITAILIFIVAVRLIIKHVI